MWYAISMYLVATRDYCHLGFAWRDEAKYSYYVKILLILKKRVLFL